MAAQGFYWHGISGDANRPDMLGQWFVDDPAKHIASGVAEADALGLRYMLTFMAGYNRATAGVQPDGSRVLINSNLAGMLPHIFTAVASNPRVTACNIGWHAAANWRTQPHRIDTMPKETDARPLSAADRRKWVRLHLSPLQAATNIRYWAFDGSEGDPAGVSVAEAELRRDEVADCYLELPPTLPDSSRPNGLRLDTAKLAQYPTLGAIGQWDFCARDHGLHYSRVPAGVECHLIVLPDFGDGFNAPPSNVPDPREVRRAMDNGWVIGVGSGWPLAQAKAILSPPPATATEPAAGS